MRNFIEALTSYVSRGYQLQLECKLEIPRYHVLDLKLEHRLDRGYYTTLPL